MTLYRSVTAAWLWIVHAATIPAVQSVCKRWFDDSIQTAECLHRTWRYSPMRACVRRSGLSVVLQWKCVFMLSWCCVSVVTGQVLWDCARNVSSPSFPFFVFPTLTRFISTTQPIADMSPMRRSTSSLTPQRGVREVSLSDYDLERPKMSPGQTLDQRERGRELIIITIIITAASGEETRSTNRWIEPSARSSHRLQVGSVFLSHSFFYTFQHIHVKENNEYYRAQKFALIWKEDFGPLGNSPVLQWIAGFLLNVSQNITIKRTKDLNYFSLCALNLIHEFHNLSWITEINKLFHDILIYWDAPVIGTWRFFFVYLI